MKKKKTTQNLSYCTQSFPAETTAVNYLAAFTLPTSENALIDTDSVKSENRTCNKISEWYSCWRAEADKQLHKSSSML